MYQLNPLQDARWGELIARHSAASIFHTPEWMEALRRTYNYEPAATTLSPPRCELKEGVATCFVNSWLTGRRLVSLPFSDHCDPLVDNLESFQSMLFSLRQQAINTRCSYLEFRPAKVSLAKLTYLQKAGTYYAHTLDLTPPGADLFRSFHRDCIQRKIQRAEREALSYHVGNSPALVRTFYEMQVITRRRQHLPPQPLAWFQNLATCMGDKMQIRLLSKDSTPIACILTLRFRKTVVYKYGCSDKRFSNVGGMPLLFWRTIQESKAEGYSEIDLGRSDLDNDGLIRFKERFGATRSTLEYWKSGHSLRPHISRTRTMATAKTLFSRLPKSWLVTAGSLLYRHIG